MCFSQIGIRSPRVVLFLRLWSFSLGIRLLVYLLFRAFCDPSKSIYNYTMPLQLYNALFTMLDQEILIASIKYILYIYTHTHTIFGLLSSWTHDE